MIVSTRVLMVHLEITTDNMVTVEEEWKTTENSQLYQQPAVAIISFINIMNALRILGT